MGLVGKDEGDSRRLIVGEMTVDEMAVGKTTSAK